jgi:CheY-like chemotaxis protein
LTARAIRGDAGLCLEAGMDEYLAKPVQVGVLESTLLRVVAERPAD